MAKKMGVHQEPEGSRRISALKTDRGRRTFRFDRARREPTNYTWATNAELSMLAKASVGNGIGIENKPGAQAYWMQVQDRAARNTIGGARTALSCIKHKQAELCSTRALTKHSKVAFENAGQIVRQKRLEPLYWVRHCACLKHIGSRLSAGPPLPAISPMPW